MKAPLLILSVALGLTLVVFAAEKSSNAEGKLRHVVAFKFKEGTAREKIKEVEDAFRDLKKKIKEIQDYEWGTNVSIDDRIQSCTHGFILSVKNETDRDTYLDHPAHTDFGSRFGPVLDDVFVIDFRARD